jgi:hypothetical protein
MVSVTIIESAADGDRGGVSVAPRKRPPAWLSMEIPTPVFKVFAIASRRVMRADLFSPPVEKDAEERDWADSLMICFQERAKK